MVDVVSVGSWVETVASVVGANVIGASELLAKLLGVNSEVIDKLSVLGSSVVLGSVNWGAVVLAKTSVTVVKGGKVVPSSTRNVVGNLDVVVLLLGKAVVLGTSVVVVVNFSVVVVVLGSVTGATVVAVGCFSTTSAALFWLAECSIALKKFVGRVTSSTGSIGTVDLFFDGRFRVF